MSTEKYVIGESEVTIHKLPPCTNLSEISEVSSSFSGNIASLTITTSSSPVVTVGLVDFNSAMTALNKSIDEQTIKALEDAINRSQLCFILDPEIELFRSLINCMQKRSDDQHSLSPIHKQNLKLELLADFIIKSSFVPFAGFENEHYLRNLRFVAIKQGKLHIIPLFK